MRLRNTHCKQSGGGEQAAGAELAAVHAVFARRAQASAWATFIPELFTPRQFVTQAYREETSLNSVLRRHGYLVQEVNREIFGNNWRRHGDGISFVLGVEPQLRGVLHSHAVWDADFVPYGLIHSRMKKLGGFAWVEPVTATCGVGHYVTKYAVKSGQVHVYLSRQMRALRNAGLGLTTGGCGRDAFIS